MIEFTCYKAYKEEQADFFFPLNFSMLVSLWWLRLLRPKDAPVCFVYEKPHLSFYLNPRVL